MFTGHSRIMGFQYGICFMSSFWHLEFEEGSYIYAKSVDGCHVKMSNLYSGMVKTAAPKIILKYHHLITYPDYSICGASHHNIL
jgi:hypothetical protein